VGQFRTVVQEICDTLKGQIMGGVYGAGADLPSTRALANELGVSRTTVTAAYEQLLAEGFLETRQGARTRVARSLALAAPHPKKQSPRSPPVVLSSYGRRIAGIPTPPQAMAEQMIADFRYGDLSASDFPTLMWKRALNAAVLRRPERLRYGDPRGSASLRLALQGYLWRTRSLRCDLDQIIVVNGSQQGLDLCARLLLDPGDRVVMEDPCYAMARQAFMAAGAVPVPIEVDQEGMRTAQLTRVGAARLAFVTPSHQFPLGSVMSVGRRRELLAWAQRTDAYVIEDDYDSEYRFDIRPIQPVHAMADAENVIYLGTISKTLSPTLRLGYLVVPVALREPFATAKQLADRHTPGLGQEALTDLITSGAYERHVRRVRRRNAERRATLLEALSAGLGERATIVGADAGLHVVVWFNDVPQRQESELIRRARDAGVGVYPVTPLYSSVKTSYRPDRAGLVMGYASLDGRTIERGARSLTTVLKELTPPASCP
jgi:GntR family transcriptional regulator/MocR family aminotransferase